ncbi:MAG: cytochrome c3 family protein [Smithellaceae bacterium]|nr:cytochrome c3 family protein [Smithellaceae bacterium]
MRREPAALLLIPAIIFLCAIVARGASVVGSKHDLSTSSTNSPCAFCHTPHFASAQIAAPLWNRNVKVVTYQMYSSPSIDTTIPGAPAGVSLACLGCHDGAAKQSKEHSLLNAPGPRGVPDSNSWPNCQRCHPQMYTGGLPVKWLGTDLRNDHPISMTYPTTAQDAGFFLPPDLQKGWSDIPLYNGKVECASCHNVHDPARTPFLRVSNSGSTLCYRCHNK